MPSGAGCLSRAAELNQAELQSSSVGLLQQAELPSSPRPPSEASAPPEAHGRLDGNSRILYNNTDVFINCLQLQLTII